MTRYGHRAMTLWQPWATLVALGVKTIETRSWPAPAGAVGERLLIHAAARKPESFVIGDWRAVRPDGARAFPSVTEAMWNYAHPHDEPVPLPLGAIVASATLAACVPMVEDAYELDPPALVLDDQFLWWTHDIADGVEIADQLPYGDFAPGRWAWILEDVKPTTERCPACWGRGWDEGNVTNEDRAGTCPTCGGGAVCEPVPAKGGQRVWRWKP